MKQKEVRLDLIGELFIPLAYLLVVLGLEYTTSRATITPLFGIIGLMVMAFCLRPSWMAVWGFVYSLVVACIFLLPAWTSFFNSSNPHAEALTPLVRTGAFVVGATLATLLCFSLNRSRALGGNLRKMIEVMPVPLIASDVNGRIFLINNSAHTFLGLDDKEKSSKSYFELLAPKNHKGKTISDYLRRFEDQFVTEPLVLDCHGVAYRGFTLLIESTDPPLLMTTIKSASVLETVLE
jgi:PAS domain-containing protein